MDLDDQRVVLDVRGMFQGTQRQELHVAEALVVAGGGGFLKGSKVGLGCQGFRHMAPRVANLVLVQDGQDDSSRERPFQHLVILPLHEVDEEGQVAPPGRVHSVEVGAHAQFVAP